MRKKKSTDKINEMLDKTYHRRIDLGGMYHGRRSVCLFYCHGCKEYFWQNIWSLQQGFRTRCLCSYPNRLDPDAEGRSSAGHRCLPEWECYDRVPPTQRLEPESNAEGP